MTGPVLGRRYVLGDLLGRGGMAEVHRARDEVLGRDVAVKLFRVGDLDGTDHRRTAEIRILAGLSHTGLVTVFDAGQDGDTTYLVMELVEGTTLRRRLDRGPLTPEETARIGADLAGALAYVHSRGIVHRDVKPANVLLAEDGAAKLTDFGVAKLLDGTSITSAGTTLGTANYLSPEQASGEPLSGASDVYSLGLVLLECLTGVLAFPGSGVPAAVVRLRRAPQIPATLDPPWPDLLARMTDRDPAGRPGAAAVAAALGAPDGGAAGNTGNTGNAVDAATTQLLTPVPTSSPRAPRRMGWLAVAMTATVAAIAALAVVLAVSTGRSEDPTTPGAPAPTTTTSVETAATPTGASTAATPSATTTPTTPTTTVVPPKEPPKPPPAPPHKPKDDKPKDHKSKDEKKSGSG